MQLIVKFIVLVVTLYTDYSVLGLWPGLPQACTVCWWSRASLYHAAIPPDAWHHTHYSWYM